MNNVRNDIDENSTPEDVGNELIVMMNSLSDIMVRETAALKAKEMKVLKKTSCDKIQLLREYQRTLVVLSNNPRMLQSLKGDLRQKLRETRDSCEKIARTNHSSLKGALQATQGLVETIVKAAVKSARKMDSYKDPRKTGHEPGTLQEYCDPVAFCQIV